MSVIAIDKTVRSIDSEAITNVWRNSWFGGRGNVAHMAIWILFFGAMSLFGKMDGQHTGDSLPFWEQACADGLPNACERLVQLERTYCNDNAAWACNELGAHYREAQIVAADEDLALAFFARACELKFQAGCVNLLEQDSIARAEPRELDLRLLLREGGQNLMEAPLPELYDRACNHNWSFACQRSGNQT